MSINIDCIEWLKSSRRSISSAENLYIKQDQLGEIWYGKYF